MIRTLHAASMEIRQGRVTPGQLLDECLAQIDRLEDRIHAWVLVDRDGARAQVEALASELKQGKYRGPLHGIPIAIKDIADVFDWPTAAGSRLWAQSIARQDAPVVANLRSAGAVFLGKTVTTQYASFDPPVTRNPWNPERTPGGSSSGSAAALACGMCLGALGSQTGGSLTRPASFCGVATIKPTFGLVNCEGILPLAPSMDHPGPMARCVRDLAMLLQVMADNRERPVPHYLQLLTGPTSAPRLGRLRGLFEERAEAVTTPMMDSVTARFREWGAMVSEVGLPAAFAEVIPRHRTIMAVEGAAFHQQRLQRHPQDYLPKIRSLLEEGLHTPAPEYVRCKEHQQQLTRAMTGCFAGVDALLTPATLGPAPDATTTGDPAFNSPWSYTGHPTLSIPAAWTTDGMPLAIQLVARHGEEDKLLAAAAWCEQNLGWEPREVK